MLRLVPLWILAFALVSCEKEAEKPVQAPSAVDPAKKDASSNAPSTAGKATDASSAGLPEVKGVVEKAKAEGESALGDLKKATASTAETAGAVPATAKERSAAMWSFAYFFALLAGYYVLRPLRDQMGIAGGVKNLPWLFTATFVSLLVAQPLYGALVARLPRVRFIPIVYHFFVANLALFWVLLTLDVEKVIVARVFFVWLSG